MTPPRLDDARAAAGLAVLDDPDQLRRFSRLSLAADGARIADSSLRITGMHCAACAGTIEQALAGVDGVIEVSVSAAGERARVRWNTARTRIEAIFEAVRSAGYGAVPDAALEAREARRTEQRAALWRLFVASFCAMQVMMFATPGYVAGAQELAPDLRQLLNWGSWVLALPVLVFSSGPFFRGAWSALRQRRIGMDVPVSLGIAVTFVASSGATFDPGGVFGREVYFDSMTMFVAFLLAGRWLEVRARHRVAQVLESAMQGMPQVAERLAGDGRTETVAVERLCPGDRVRVAMGQAFPADGQVIEGATEADESLLTGESRPVPRGAGDAVTGGSVNVGAPVVMRVERVGADTRLEAIVALMRDAMSQRPALARMADRWAAPFLWTVLLLAALGAAVWSVVDPPRAVWIAVSVLIVTCPCALSLAVPAALLSAASALARRGLLVQRLDALETCTRVSRVYFDKTGTVTDERLRWRSIERLSGGEGTLDDAALLRRAGSLAAWSRHPLSQALAEHGRDGAVAWSGVREEPGRGLAGRDPDGCEWRLGAREFVDAARPPGDESSGRTSVWFGRAGVAHARIDFEESPRADAGEAIAALRASGLELVLLSGDARDRAAAMAVALGFDRAIGGATPESKLAEVAAAQAEGATVAMVGDGINDAPVLARADLSLAMGQGALVARAQSDVIVASCRLADLPVLIDTAHRTMRVVRQNLGWAAAYNLACIPLALAGWLPPWAAGLGMAGSSLFVILNANVRLAR